MDFCLFIRILVKILVKNVSGKYSQKLLHSAKKSTTDAIKTASKRPIQKTTEATEYLSGSKISDKKRKKSSKELHSKNENELDVLKERYISPEKQQQIIDELRLI